MMNKDPILQDRLDSVKKAFPAIQPDGGFGAVLARAGVGKTAILVQFAVHGILEGKNVLHVALNEPVKKIDVWYKEVIHNLRGRSKKKEEVDHVWESILRHRLIMTFKKEDFLLPKLMERIDDLEKENIFIPRLVLIDGFDFNESAFSVLSELKHYTQKRLMTVWFAMQIHRHETPGSDGFPPPFSGISDLFETAVRLKPKGKDVYVVAVKGEKDLPAPLRLDPSTLLLKR